MGPSRAGPSSWGGVGFSGVERGGVGLGSAGEGMGMHWGAIKLPVPSVGVPFFGFGLLTRSFWLNPIEVL